MFVLLVPLYIAVDNLVIHEKREIKTSSIIVIISTSSDWARASFNGASIKDYRVLDKTGGLKDPIIDQTGIILNKYMGDGAQETVKLELELGVFDRNVELVTTKDYNGEMSVNIDKIGEYKNNKKPLQLPITIETTSDWTKVELNGATIRNAKILDIKGATLREPIIGTKSIILAKLEGNDTSSGSAKILLDLSLDTYMPIVTIDKADNGMTKVSVGDLTLENNLTAAKIFKNIPLTIETTSDKTEINFKGLYLRKVKPIELDKNDLSESIAGSNFIFLNYSHLGNSYRKASYLIDFGATNTPADITIMKSDPGYTVVNLATYSFASIGKSENKSITYPIEPSNLPSTTVREPLFELDQIKEEDYSEKILPLRIETTSDWTEVMLKDATITSAEVKTTSGNIEKPVIGANNILIKKPASYDNSFASAELLLHLSLNENFIDQRKDAITITIAKGDIGTTTVQIGKTGLVNAENIKNDPRNTKTYEIQLDAMQAEKKNGEETLYNPAAYSIPLFNELYKQGIELVDTQEMQEVYSISSDMFPGRDKIDLNLRKSEAMGLLSFVILSYLVLIVVGINILSKEGFFDFIPGLIGENKTKVQTISDFAVKLFEKTPASSLFILEALIVLAITPFVLMVDQTYAEGTAILAYFLLVFGVGLRTVGEIKSSNKIFNWFDSKIVMFIIKIESIVMVISAVVIAGFELIGIYGSLAIFLFSLLVIATVYKYLRNNFEDSSFTYEW